VAVIDSESVKLPAVDLAMPRQGTVSHTLTVPDHLPNKLYTWVLTFQREKPPANAKSTPPVQTKTGKKQALLAGVVAAWHV
jgi:hypothetical protein